jgi:hypothetical protein
MRRDTAIGLIGAAFVFAATVSNAGNAVNGDSRRPARQRCHTRLWSVPQSRRPGRSRLCVVPDDPPTRDRNAGRRLWAAAPLGVTVAADPKRAGTWCSSAGSFWMGSDDRHPDEGPRPGHPGFLLYGSLRGLQRRLSRVSEGGWGRFAEGMWPDGFDGARRPSRRTRRTARRTAVAGAAGSGEAEVHAGTDGRTHPWEI